MYPDAHPAGGSPEYALIVWVVAVLLGFGAFVVFAGSSRDRRPHFWLRVLLLPVAPSALLAIVAGAQALKLITDGVLAALVPVVAVLTLTGLMVVPVLLYRPPGSSGPSDEDGGGGGRGPGGPPSPELGSPSGGIPLPDAEPARTRLRDHNGPRFGRSRPRRPAREPDPARTPVKRANVSR
jgi:hypothetical protein